MSGQNSPSEQKIELEVIKLRQDTGWRSRAIPFASILFGIASLVVTVAQVREGFAKNDRDHVIACANTAVAVAALSERLVAAMKEKPSVGDKVKYIDEVRKSFSADFALQLVTMLGTAIPPDERADFLNLQKNLTSASKCPHS